MLPMKQFSVPNLATDLCRKTERQIGIIVLNVQGIYLLLQKTVYHLHKKTILTNFKAWLWKNDLVFH